MNVATLEAALPALTVALLTDVTDAAQVLVGDEWPTARRSGVSVRWEFSSDTPVQDAGGLGRPMHALRYSVEIRGPAMTQAARRTLVQEFRGGLHHRCKPVTVPGLDHAQVLNATVGPEGQGVSVPGGTGAALATLDVAFFGDQLTTDAGA